MNSLRVACYAFSASALFLAGMWIHAVAAPAPVQAATTAVHNNVSTATAKIQTGEDGLFVLSGDTLLVYRTNVGAKQVELVASRKIGGGDDAPPVRHGGGR